MDDKATHLQPDENTNNHLTNNAQIGHGHITVIGGGIAVTGNMNVGPGAMVAGRDIIINNYPPLSFDPSPESPNFIPRPEVLDQLRQAVLENNDPSVALTALHGMGGIGKTALTAALCHDRKIKEHFSGGIIWVTIGREPRDLENKIQQAKLQIRGKLNEDKSVLLVIDDVWDISHIQPLFFGSPLCHTLFTTRDVSIATSLGAREIKLGVMTPDQATKLLRKWAEKDDPAFLQIAQRLGFLPLALQLAGAIIKAENWSGHEWLEEFRRISDIRLGHYSDKPSDNLMVSLDLSVQVLPESDHFLYYSLGIFPEEAWVPRTVAVRLWQEYRPDLRELDCKRLVVELSKRSMLEWDDKSDRFTMHDMLREYTREQLGDRWIATHQTLLKTYNPKARPWAEIEEDGYLTDHLVYHLEQAEWIDQIHDLFTSKDWTERCSRLNRRLRLLGDFQRAHRLVDSKTGELSQVIRYTLFESMIRKGYKNIPVSALEASYDAKLIDAESTLPTARNMSGNSRSRLESYLRIPVSKLSPEDQQKYVDDIIQIEAEWKDWIKREERKDNFSLLMRLLARVEDISPDKATKLKRSIWWGIFPMLAPCTEEWEEFGPSKCNQLIEEILEEFLAPLLYRLTDDETKKFKMDILKYTGSGAQKCLINQTKSILLEYLRQSGRLSKEEIDQAYIGLLNDALMQDKDVYSPTFRHLIPYLPSALLNSLSDEDWQYIICSPNEQFHLWGDFYFRFLEAVIPYIPDHVIPLVWQRVQENLSDTSRVQENFREESVTVVAPYIPDHLLSELEMIKEKFPIGEYRAGPVIDIILACKKPGLAPRARLDRVASFLKKLSPYAETNNYKNAFSVIPDAMYPDLWERMFVYIRKDCLNTKNRPVQSIFEQLSTLARYCPRAYSESSWRKLIEEYEQPLWVRDERYPLAILNEDHIVKILLVFLDQFLKDQRPQQWRMIFEAVLNLLGPNKTSYISLSFALLRSIENEQLQKEMLDYIEEKVGHDVDYYKVLAKNLDVFPLETQFVLWMKLVDTVIDDYENTRIEPLDLLSHEKTWFSALSQRHPSEFSRRAESIVQWLVEHKQGLSYTFSASTGIKYCVSKALPETQVVYWKLFHHDSNVLSIIVIPHLSSKQQELLMQELLNDFDMNRSEYNNISHWSGDLIHYMWEKVINAISENVGEHSRANRLEYWAVALAEQMPSSYAYSAWKMIHHHSVSPYWAVIKDVEIPLIHNLAKDDVLRVWKELVWVKRHDKYAYIDSEVETAVAERLTPEHIQTLYQEALNIPSSEIIRNERLLKCGMRFYIKRLMWIRFDK